MGDGICFGRSTIGHGVGTLGYFWEVPKYPKTCERIQMMSGLLKKVPFGKFILLFATWTVLAYLCFPFMVIVPLSFTSSDRLSFPPPGFSLRWYEHFFNTPK